MFKKIALFLLFIFLGFIVLLAFKKKVFVKPQNDNNIFAKLSIVSIPIKARAQLLKSYISKNGYNEEYCFIINMAIPSGNPRFFVYNLKKDSIEDAGLVTHGSGSENTNGNLVFKNVPNSLASSKGKYKIGVSYYGKFGLAYKLHGLDSTNDKAFQRFVVLHSHECVPSKPVDPLPICVSWGCPTVAPDFLKTLQTKIDATVKPILLDLQYLK